MGKHWTKEERAYFLKEVLPKSKYATGEYVEGGGIAFEPLAEQMQQDLDQRNQSRRVYSADVLFQHWYQKVRQGVKSRTTSHIYAPSYPGNSTTQGSYAPRSVVHPSLRGPPGPYVSPYPRYPVIRQGPPAPSSSTPANGEDQSDGVGIGEGRSHSLLGVAKSPFSSPTSPAGGVLLSENLPTNNSLLRPTYTASTISSSTELSSSTDRPPRTTQTTSTSTKAAVSTMASLADQRLDDLLGNLDEDIQGDADRFNLGEDHVKPESDHHITLGEDDASNNRKRPVDETEHDDPFTHTAAKKSKTKTTAIKGYKVGDFGEVVASSNPPSPSPIVAKHSQGRSRKAPKEGSDEDEYTVVNKKLNAGGRKKVSKAVNVISDPNVIIAIQSDEGIDKPKGVKLKHKSGVGEGQRGPAGDSRVTARQHARGGGHQRSHHTPAAGRASIYDEEDENLYDDDDDDDLEYYSQRRQDPRNYAESYGTASPAYNAYAPRYGPQALDVRQSVYQNHYGHPSNPTVQSQIPYNFSRSGHTQYPSRPTGPPLPQHPLLGRSAPSFNAYNPGPPALSPFGIASTNTIVSRPSDPASMNVHPTLSHPGRPAYAHFNRNTSFQPTQHGADPANAGADTAKNPPGNGVARPKGRIYINGGHQVMVEECPCCRRGFEGQA